MHDVPANFAAQIRPLEAKDLQSLQSEMTAVTVTDENNTNSVDSNADPPNTATSSSNCSNLENSSSSFDCPASADAKHDISQVASAAICAKNSIQVYFR